MHHHAGADERRVPPRAPNRVAQRDQLLGRDVGRRGDAVERARLEQRAQPLDVGSVGVRLELAVVRAVTQQLTHEPREHEVVGTRAQRDVAVGERGGLGAHGIEHPQLAAGAAELADARDRVREGGAVTVRDHGVGTEDHEQLRVLGVPHRRELHVAGDELGRPQYRGVVDRDRRVPLLRVQQPEQPFGGVPAVEVVREAGGEIRADGVVAVLGADRHDAVGEVVEDVVPRRIGTVEARRVEPVGMVMHRRDRTALRARVSARDRVAGIAPHLEHAVAVDLDDDPAQRRADATEAQVLRRHGSFAHSRGRGAELPWDVRSLLGAIGSAP